jgi:hypothetical protein
MGLLFCIPPRLESVKKKMPRCGVFIPVDKINNYLDFIYNRINTANAKQVRHGFFENEQRKRCIEVIEGF